MDDTIAIEFTEEELKDVLLNYYGDDEDTFDINDYSDEAIKNALLGI
jgi:hypothetical protein